MGFLAALLMLGGVLFSRPMVLGTAYGQFGVFFFLVSIALSFLLARNIKSKKEHASVLVRCLIFGSAFSILLLFSSFGHAVSSFLIVFTSSLSTFAAFAMHEKVTLFAVKLAFRVIVVSGAITGGFFVYNEISAFSSTWAFIEVPTDRDNLPIAHIRFPVSTILTNFSSGYFVWGRSSFLLIEPGIAPALLAVWRALEEKEGSTQVLLDSLFVLAMLLTLSTTGPLALGLYFSARSILYGGKRWRLVKMSWAILLLISFLIVLLFAPHFGYFAKIETHGASFEERIYWFEGEGLLYQLGSAVLAIWFFVSLRNHINHTAYLFIPTMLAVVVLNVIEFSPVFILSAFLAVSQEKRSSKKLRLQPYQRKFNVRAKEGY